MIHRRKRWACYEYRACVRTLPCRCGDDRCPACTEGAPGDATVIAAHLRCFTGMGQRPSDWWVYPLSAHIHQVFHNEGQPSIEWQIARVDEVWLAAIAEGEAREFFEGVPF